MGVILSVVLWGTIIAAMLGWIYFWMLCVSNTEKILEPIFGGAALAVAFIGFPFLFFGLMDLIIVYFHGFGRWLGALFALFIPALGIWSVKKEKW